MFDSVFGIQVVYKEIIEAILQYGSFDALHYFGTGNNQQRLLIERMIRKARPEGINLFFHNKRRLVCEQKKICTDVWHNVSDSYISTLYGREFLSNNKPPITYTVHCASKSHELYRNILLQLLLPFQAYDTIICTSLALRSALIQQFDIVKELIKKTLNIELEFNGRFTVVPLGVNTERFVSKNKYENRKKLRIPTHATVILWVGRFSAFDKADLIPLLRVISKVIHDESNVHLVLAGHDIKNMRYTPFLKKYISDFEIEKYITIIENNEIENRHELIACADIFISPVDSIQETYGLTPIEAMACGVPQIVSDWDGYKDTVQDGITGFRIQTRWYKADDDLDLSSLFFTEDYPYEAFYSHYFLGQSVVVDIFEFERKLRLLITNRDLREKMSQASISYAREKLSWPVVVKQYEEVWIEALTIQKSTPYKENILGWELLKNRYYDIFSHYATSKISDNERMYLASPEKMIHQDYYGLGDDLIEMSLAERILSLFKCDENAKGLSLSEIISQIQTRNRQEVIIRSILFLLKNGYLVI